MEKHMLMLLLFLLPELLAADGSLQYPSTGSLDFDRAVCLISGAAAPEEVGEERMQDFRQLHLRPLALNRVAAEEIRTSILFTPFQVAALLDYMEKTGPVLSAMELGQIDGFTSDLAAAASLFLDFSLHGDTLAPRSKREKHQLWFRCGFSVPGVPSPPSCQAAFRYAADDLGGWSIRLGCSWPGERLKFLPLDLTGSLTWKHRRVEVMAGDLNVRFGQGLVLWNSLAFSSLPSTSTLQKNPRFLSLPESYTGGTALPGMGMKIGTGPFLVTGSLTFPENPEGITCLPALNFSWFGRRIRIGHSLAMQTPPFRERSNPGRNAWRLASSIDFAACFRGTDIFGELAVDWLDFRVAVLLGFNQALGEQVHLALSAYHYPAAYTPVVSAARSTVAGGSDETGALLVAEYHSPDRHHAFCSSSDFAWHPEPLRTIAAGDWQLRTALTYSFSSPSGWNLAARYSAKDRGNLRGNASRYTAFKFRNELRLDGRFVQNRWEVACRTHFQYSEGFSFLAYLEGGWKPDWGTFYLRQGFFSAEHWEDRIYAYERDFPLTFSVPAYYGKGWWCSFLVRAAPVRWCLLGVKATYISWPWNKTEKPGKAGLKLWCAFRF